MKTHRNVTARQEALAENKLYSAIVALETAEECRAFFRDLCTPAEIQAMSDRWIVVDYLRRGLPYREIHRLTGVSVTTIGRVARFLADGSGGYAAALRRLGGTNASSGTSDAQGQKDAGGSKDAGTTRRTGTARRAEAVRHG